MIGIYEKENIELFEIIVLILSLWLFWKGLGLAFKITWCMAKVVAFLLMVLAAPILLAVLLFAGGLLLLIPLALIAAAVCILKALT